MDGHVHHGFAGYGQQNRSKLFTLLSVGIRSWASSERGSDVAGLKAERPPGLARVPRPAGSGLSFTISRHEHRKVLRSYRVYRAEVRPENIPSLNKAAF